MILPVQIYTFPMILLVQIYTFPAKYASENYTFPIIEAKKYQTSPMEWLWVVGCGILVYLWDKLMLGFAFQPTTNNRQPTTNNPSYIKALYT